MLVGWKDLQQEGGRGSTLAGWIVGQLKSRAIGGQIQGWRASQCCWAMKPNAATAASKFLEAPLVISVLPRECNIFKIKKMYCNMNFLWLWLPGLRLCSTMNSHSFKTSSAVYSALFCCLNGRHGPFSIIMHTECACYRNWMILSPAPVGKCILSIMSSVTSVQDF